MSWARRNPRGKDRASWMCLGLGCVGCWLGWVVRLVRQAWPAEVMLLSAFVSRRLCVCGGSSKKRDLSALDPLGRMGVWGSENNVYSWVCHFSGNPNKWLVFLLVSQTKTAPKGPTQKWSHPSFKPSVNLSLPSPLCRLRLWSPRIDRCSSGFFLATASLCPQTQKTRRRRRGESAG